MILQCVFIQNDYLVTCQSKCGEEIEMLYLKGYNSYHTIHVRKA